MTTRPSQVQSVVNAIVQPIVQIIVGFIFLVGGVIITARSLNHEPHDKWLVSVGFATAIGGALILPGIFTVVKPIYITIFPNGLPLLGGRRASDPPAPPPPADPVGAPAPRVSERGDDP